MKYVNRILAVVDDINKKVGEAVQETAREVRDIARDLAPVDTGTLRDSIQSYKDGENHAVIGTIVEYAGFQEFGTSRTPATPFLTPALIEGKSILEKKLKEKLT